MKSKKLLFMLSLAFMLLFTAACGTAEPTPTPAPPVEDPPLPTAAPATEEAEMEEEMAEPTAEPTEEMAEEEMEGPTMSIAEIAAADEQFSTLVTALEAADLTGLLASDGAYTVFAPTNEAFAQLPDGTLDALLEDPDGALTDVLLYHVIDEVAMAEEVVGLDSVTTLQGEPLTIEVDTDNISLNDGRVGINTADIMATNGVIHIVDNVLLPPSMIVADEGDITTQEEEETDEEIAVEMAASAVEYEIPGDAVYPEGIAYDSQSNSFFTDSTGDGTIFRGSIETGEVTVFAEPGIDGRTAAIGLAVDELNRRLWVAGGATQRMYVFDIESGEQIASFQAPEAETSFINDVIVDSEGNAYFTDSFRPEIFVIRNVDGEVGDVETFLDLSETIIPYDSSFNVNGIVITPDDQYLILNHSGANALFRIDIASGEVIQIETDEPVGGDGMVLEGTTLYTVQGEIYQIELSEDYSTGEVVQTFGDESFIRPTTIALYANRLLVVNSQFNNRSSGTPELPFTITDMPIPEPAE